MESQKSEVRDRVRDAPAEEAARSAWGRVGEDVTSTRGRSQSKFGRGVVSG